MRTRAILNLIGHRRAFKIRLKLYVGDFGSFDEFCEAESFFRALDENVDGSFVDADVLAAALVLAIKLVEEELFQERAELRAE